MLQIVDFITCVHLCIAPIVAIVKCNGYSIFKSKPENFGCSG